MAYRSRTKRRHPLRHPVQHPVAWAACIACACMALPLVGQAQPAGASEEPMEPVRTLPRVDIVERFRDRPGKTSLSGEELSRVPGTGGDPMKAIQSLPGVAVADDTSGDPAVRGARPSDNAYFVDFLPVGYLFHLGGFASVFNADLIQRFSLSSAAWSPEYGNAVGAVFDVALRQPRSDRLHAKADFSLLGANALVEGPIGGDISFFLAARRSWFDLLAKTGEDKEEGVTYTVPVYSDSQGRLLWRPTPDTRLRLDFSTANDRIAYTVKNNSKAGARDPLLVGDSSSRQAFNSLAAVLETDLGTGLSNRIALGRMQRTDQASVGAAGNAKLGTTTTYLRQQLQWVVSENHDLTLGGSLQSALVDVDLDFNFPRCTEFDPNCDITSAPRLVSKQQSRQNAADLYINDRWQFATDWAVTTGLRLNRDDYLKHSSVEPRVTLEHNWSANTVLSVGAGRHSQAPSIDQSIARIGNPNLKPLESTHLVLGITQQLAEGWSWRTEVYGKRFENYAVADPVLNYRNGASGTARGAELLVRKDPSGPGWGALSGFASLSLSRASRKIDASGEQFPFDFDQPVIATVVANYKLSDRWQFGAKWTYHTGSPYTPVVGTGQYPDGRVRPVYGSVNSQRVPDYHRLDLRVDHRFTPRLTGYLELINAYARKNVAGYSYSPDYKTRGEILQLSVLPSFGIKYEY
jgi:TonB dependent receptor/TonB-dependent Receptor Plug Domain